MQESSHDRDDGPEGARSEAGERHGLILLVEDNEVDREVYGRLLWYNGYSLLHASDGKSAVAKALQSRPDLIILDMMLEGEMTGVDIAERLRSEGLQIPMIALSAVKRAKFGAAIEEAGILAYLEKPVDPFVVVREVLRHVGAGAEPQDPGAETGTDGGT